MCKKSIHRIGFVLPLIVAGLASVALGIDWDAGGDGRLWRDPLNWVGDTLPVAADAAVINIQDANCVIDATTKAIGAALSVSRTNKPCYLTMNGGTLTTSGIIYIAGQDSDANAVFTVNAGTVSTSNTGRMQVGMKNGAHGVFILNGGEVTASDKIEVGKEAGSNGSIYVYGGTLNIAGYGSDDLEIAVRGTGAVYVIGGVVNVTDAIKLAQGSATQTTGVGRLYIYGGTVNANSLLAAATAFGNPLIDITEGTLVLRAGTAQTMVNDYLNRGWLIGYGGLGRIVATTEGGLTTVKAVMADPNVAWNPGPASLSTVQWTPAGPTLTWRPGKRAVSHNVYFGTSKEDVNNANNTPGLWPQFRGKQDPCSYSPGRLELGKTYYWRIDEVNDNAWALAGSPWKGTVWEFTVANYAVVDDMQSYGNASTPGPPPPAGSRMWYTWKDGEGWTDPSLVAGNGTGSVVEPNSSIFHGGSQSLKFYYDNDGANLYNSGGKKYYSEVRADTSYLSIKRDWTLADVRSLELWFYGNPDNDANATEQMYVKLNGVKVNYSGNMNDIRTAAWQAWDIDLAAFGITLSNVTEIAIGFGNETNTTTKGGSGFVYFDDIRAYPSRCMPALKKPAGDLDNDCDVDYADLRLMATAWLQRDSMRVGSDGVLRNFPTDNSQWVSDPTRGRCLLFDGVDDWVDINDADFSDFHNKTISMWVNVRSFPADGDPYIFCFRDNDDIPYAYRVYIREHGTNNVRMQFVGSASTDYSKDFSGALPNTWHHVAFVLRDTGTDTCTGEFYGDAALIDEMPGRPRHYGAARSINIGSWNDGASPFIAASVDDFRIYDGALSANEIKYLAGLAGGVAPSVGMMFDYRFDEVSGSTAKNSSTYAFNRPLLSVAELYMAEAPGARLVNFMDYAVLAGVWLQQQLWP